MTEEQENFIKEIKLITEEREDLSNRLYECLKHLPIKIQYYIITSRMDIEDLRKFVALEEFAFNNQQIT